VHSLRSFQTSSKALADPAASKPVTTPARPTSVNVNPSRPNLPHHDPLYNHPPSSAKTGTTLKGCQILKDKAEIIAGPDHHYPDWLWQLLDDDPAPLEAIKAFRREEQKKREAYVAGLEAIEREKKLEEIEISARPTDGKKRTEDEKWEARRNALNQKWLVNRETEYDFPQFEMPQDRNRKYHRAIRKEKIKMDNYLRAKGLK